MQFLCLSPRIAICIFQQTVEPFISGLPQAVQATKLFLDHTVNAKQHSSIKVESASALTT
jgi:hypothetical protein